MIEAASYHILSLLSGGDIEVCGVPSEDLFCFLSTLKASGVLCDKFDTGIRLYGKLQSKLDIVAAPYPGFPTDIAPLCAPLFAFSCGGAITDTVFPSRFGYLSALAAFGVRHELGQGSALIYPSSCHPASVTSPDLRGGMAAILLALSVEGESVIRSCELVLRGYSDLLLKLRSLGADIEFVK